jgi:phosphohistidine phosphatase
MTNAAISQKGKERIMAIYLVRHGKNLPAQEDPDKGLSDQGRKGVERLAASAKRYGPELASIKHSGKKRALQTAEILDSILNSRDGVQERNGLGPNDDVSDLAAIIDQSENTMFVGHLPFMERLTAYLITGSTEIPVVRFENGQIVCLEKDLQTGSWIIQWMVAPSNP